VLPALTILWLVVVVGVVILMVVAVVQEVLELVQGYLFLLRVVMVMVITL
jgi:hypothetical protein